MVESTRHSTDQYGPVHSQDASKRRRNVLLAQTSIASTVTPLTQEYCITRATSRAESWDTKEPTRYKLASKPAVTPPVVMIRMPPSGILARRAMDSRRRDSCHALLPLRAIDFLRPPCVFSPSPPRVFRTMYGLSSGLYKVRHDYEAWLNGAHTSRRDRIGHC